MSSRLYTHTQSMCPSRLDGVTVPNRELAGFMRARGEREARVPGADTRRCAIQRS